MIQRIKSFIRNWVVAFLYPRPLVGIFGLPRFVGHWIMYTYKARKQKINFLDLHPCLGDWSYSTPFIPHYFYQGAWIGRRLLQTGPNRHVDIGSSALTMSVLSASVNMVFVDYRPLQISLVGLQSVAGDVLNLPFRDGSVQSLSCLHVLEHIGLGRYGDPIDPQGSVKAAYELQRVMSPSGKLYISLPVGSERVCFNAHRVHAPSSVIAMFTGLTLIEFSFVDDSGQLKENQELSSANGLRYGCGLFLFEKPFS